MVLNNTSLAGILICSRRLGPIISRINFEPNMILNSLKGKLIKFHKKIQVNKHIIKVKK